MTTLTKEEAERLIQQLETENNKKIDRDKLEALIRFTNNITTN